MTMELKPVLGDISRALRAGQQINPTVIERLAAERDDAIAELAAVRYERDRLAAELANIETRIKQMPKRADSVRRWAVAVVVGASAIVAFGLGFLAGFAVGAY